MSDPLIERAAAAVAPGYRELVGEGCAGLLMAPYFYGGAEELAPLALELTEVDAFVRRDGYQEELGWPELDAEAVALCEELTRRIESEDDGQTVLDVFWLALARHMHALLGIPVLVDEAGMPIDEQLRRQLGTAPDPDPLAGLDVLLSVRIDEHRVAAVFTGGLGGLETYAFGRVGPPRDAHEACDGYAITVQCGGAPPERLDFESIRRQQVVRTTGRLGPVGFPRWQHEHGGACWRRA